MGTDTLIYRSLHFLHLTLAALWLGAAVASHVLVSRIGALPPIDARRTWYTSARRITLMIEMPVLTILVVVGLAMLALNTHVLTEPWFHIKLLLVVLLVIVFILTSVRQRVLGEALAGGEDRNAASLARSCKVLRLISAALGLILLWAVTFRLGSG